MMIFLEVSLHESRYGLLGHNDAVRFACIAMHWVIEAFNELDRGLVNPLVRPKKLAIAPQTLDR